MFSELIDHFIKAPYSWSTTTYDLNKYILTYHLEGKYLPINPTSLAMHIKHINQCWDWRIKNNLVEMAHLIPRDAEGESRLRSYKECELCVIFIGIKDDRFNSFV